MLLLRKVGTELPVVTFENRHCEVVSRDNGDIDETWYWILLLVLDLG